MPETIEMNLEGWCVIVEVCTWVVTCFRHKVHPPTPLQSYVWEQSSLGAADDTCCLVNSSSGSFLLNPSNSFHCCPSSPNCGETSRTGFLYVLCNRNLTWIPLNWTWIPWAGMSFEKGIRWGRVGFMKKIHLQSWRSEKLLPSFNIYTTLSLVSFLWVKQGLLK